MNTTPYHNPGNIVRTLHAFHLFYGGMMHLMVQVIEGMMHLLQVNHRKMTVTLIRLTALLHRLFKNGKTSTIFWSNFQKG